MKRTKSLYGLVLAFFLTTFFSCQRQFESPFEAVGNNKILVDDAKELINEEGYLSEHGLVPDWKNLIRVTLKDSFHVLYVPFSKVNISKKQTTLIFVKKSNEKLFGFISESYPETPKQIVDIFNTYFLC
jgi:hypothetical protein